MTTLLISIVGFGSLILCAGLVLFARDRISRAISHRQHPAALLAAQQAAYVQRVVSPDWVFFARHLGRAVPVALVQWFADSNKLRKAYHFGDYHVTFSAVDPEGMREAEWIEPAVVPFAISDADPIYLRPGSATRDAVFITHHDGGDVDELAPSIDVFLEGLRDAT